MVFFKPLTYKVTVTEGFARRLGGERSGVQIQIEVTHFFSNCFSQINIGSDISVVISLIANLLQLKLWKALVALYKNKLFYNFTTSPFWHSETQTNSAPSVLWLVTVLVLFSWKIIILFSSPSGAFSSSPHGKTLFLCF
jgi:hypothetical protein